MKGIFMSHNPYFSRWFSAILKIIFMMLCYNSHNPYFSRWFSAITVKAPNLVVCDVTILILVDGFLQYGHTEEFIDKIMQSQSLF